MASSVSGCRLRGGIKKSGRSPFELENSHALVIYIPTCVVQRSPTFVWRDAPKQYYIRTKYMSAKTFVIWDASGRVARTELNPLESTTKDSNISLHIMYSAIAIYSVAQKKWLKNRLTSIEAFSTLEEALAKSAYDQDYMRLPVCDIVTGNGKIVGLFSNTSGFYVGPDRVAVKVKEAEQASAEAVALPDVPTNIS